MYVCTYVYIQDIQCVYSHVYAHAHCACFGYSASLIPHEFETITITPYTCLLTTANMCTYSHACTFASSQAINVIIYIYFFIALGELGFYYLRVSYNM